MVVILLNYTYEKLPREVYREPVSKEEINRDKIEQRKKKLKSLKI